MIRLTTKTAPLAGLALAAILVSLAIGAPGAWAQDAHKPHASAEDDDHSYLPPWMRPQASAANQPGEQSPYADPAGDPRQKALALQQQQQKQRRRRGGFPFDFSW